MQRALLTDRVGEGGEAVQRGGLRGMHSQGTRERPTLTQSIQWRRRMSGDTDVWVLPKGYEAKSEDDAIRVPGY